MALRKIMTALAVTATLGVAAAGAALAAETQPAPTTAGGKALVARQAHFKEQGAAFKAIGDELRKDSPDKAVIAANATKVKGTAAALPTWFPKGSGPETGLKTAAKPDVWSDAAGFEAAAMKLQVETTKLADVAAGGDLDAIKAQFRATGGACKNCHDKFRVPDQH
ncbi:cytochrome c [Phenylobacterium sp.]|jgi:cytochrome c556|uniref:c-type cytochrome n=1 Tax=Phenylobacterium sp. TaxID=1871053 RepID=UPI002E33E2FA|nr:cytochrome c [Phenylobacterium sp.]HEX4713008.1 cytochrome c [Phenylobacterium sp.]